MSIPTVDELICKNREAIIHNFNSIYKPDFCERAFEWLSIGHDKKSLCALFSTSEESIYKWIRKFPDFKKAVDQGTAIARIKFMEALKAAKYRKDAQPAIFQMIGRNQFGFDTKPNHKKYIIKDMPDDPQAQVTHIVKQAAMGKLPLSVAMDYVEMIAKGHTVDIADLRKQVEQIKDVLKK